jgi:hypothetical protein
MAPANKVKFKAGDVVVTDLKAEQGILMRIIELDPDNPYFQESFYKLVRLDGGEIPHAVPQWRLGYHLALASRPGLDEVFEWLEGI